ncbi:tRNA nucleotidyltransferase [Bacillus cereus]|uniref:tRNA nucleotidyltransferase n=2 Tax=Bacillus TaxID=1386 RepID=A0A164QCX9_BACCE|nr:tRNA nucleotidyltransferase [Bacillus cereus]
MRELFGIKLTDEEKKNRIQAFKWGMGYRQWAAVYSKEDILNHRLVGSERA